MNSLTIQEVIAMQDKVADKIILNRDYLGEIDRKIGDGDHGEGMYNGYFAVKNLIASNDSYSSISAFFKEVGMTLLASMGGASGVLFASIYISLADASQNKHTFSTDVLLNGFTEALASLKSRGGAKVGEKTMIDALEPAVIAMKENYLNGEDLVGMLSAATKSAEIGVVATKKMTSKHGRAKSLGKRSLGYQDAGATSIALIFTAMANYVEEEDKGE